jgi:hypothetical protein
MIAILIVLLIYFIINSKENKTMMYIMIVVIVAVIAFFSMKIKDEGIITESQAKLIAFETFNNKMGTELETGTEIKLPLHCKLRKWGERWFKWEIGVTLKSPQGRVSEKMVEIDPYDGAVRGIIDMPLGYTGRDAPDFKVVFPYEYQARPSK